MNKHLYLLSGMGADERIFRYLSFPADYTVHYLDWLPPIPDETFPEYAARMAARIEHEHVTLVGVSFGGMLSLEIARQRPSYPDQQHQNYGRKAPIPGLGKENRSPAIAPAAGFYHLHTQKRFGEALPER
jgi:pimeloyl-ACP methyl ester carboxylesterase